MYSSIFSWSLLKESLGDFTSIRKKGQMGRNFFLCSGVMAASCSGEIHEASGARLAPLGTTCPPLEPVTFPRPTALAQAPSCQHTSASWKPASPPDGVMMISSPWAVRSKRNSGFCWQKSKYWSCVIVTAGNILRLMSGKSPTGVGWHVGKTLVFMAHLFAAGSSVSPKTVARRYRGHYGRCDRRTQVRHATHG